MAKKRFFTFILIGLMFLVFFSQIFFSINGFSFVPSKSFSRPWTFITAVFLHANFSHLFFNMFALFMFGIYLESKINSKDFLLIFFLAGIAGNVGYMITAMDPNIPGIGASGAIYGIMGALAAIAPFSIVYVGYMPMPMIFAAFLWGITEFLGIFAPSNIAHGSHLSGLFVGILYGIYLRNKLKKRI